MGAPSTLSQKRTKAGEREAGEMQQAGETTGPARHPKGATAHTHAFTLLEAVMVAIRSRYPPTREIGWRGDHTYAVAACRQPGPEFTAVLADTNRLRGVIKAVKKDFQSGWINSRPVAAQALEL